MRTAEFFDFVKARHAIYLARRDGKPEPWTQDPILGTYRFTNVFRELDRTTVWFRENVRDRLLGMSPRDQVLGTILFRTFNRIETMQRVFDRDIYHLDIPGWAYIRGELTIDHLEMWMRQNCPAPWVTGAYIVKTPDGMDKLRGALWIVEEARKRLPATLMELAMLDASSGGLAGLEDWHRELLTYPYLGGFTAYEIVSDLRWLPVLQKAPDIMSWAHAGPGAKRGLNRLLGKDKDSNLPQAHALVLMQGLLETARVDYCAWPEHGTVWPEWEMREVEHTLCEFDKYERVRLGEGRPRGKFR